MKENIAETRFENGPVVLTDRMPQVRSATLGFFFRVGARHEPRELTGMTHFVEHAVFKGTSRRTALDIAIEQDRLGGDLDAFTTHEETGFAIKVIDDQLPQAFDLMADMLSSPLFAEADLESEQRVIIEEMKMIDDSPEDFLGEIFSAAFFPDHPLGMPIPGTPGSVRTFDRERTQKYHAENFTPANLVIAAAGNVEHDDVIKLVDAALFSTRSAQRTQSEQPSAVSANSAVRSAPPETSSPILVKHKPDLEQAHLIIAVPFVAAVDQRRYAADLLESILGGGMSSRLWQKVREERGLAYNVGASNVMYQDCGVFSIFAATSPDQVGEVVDLSIAELRSIVNDGVTTDELKLAKQASRALILLGLEDSASRAAALAQSEMTHGRQIPVEETLAKIDSVTVEDCREVANEFFKTENVAFAALGDLENLNIARDRLKIQ